MHSAAALLSFPASVVITFRFAIAVTSLFHVCVHRLCGESCEINITDRRKSILRNVLLL